MDKVTLNSDVLCYTFFENVKQKNILLDEKKFCTHVSARYWTGGLPFNTFLVLKVITEMVNDFSKKDTKLMSAL